MGSGKTTDNSRQTLAIWDPVTSETVHVTGDQLTNANPVDVKIVDGSGNQVTSFGGSGGTSHGDDSAFTIGSASSITPIGALADETTPDSVDEGDVGVVRMTLNRILKTQTNDILTPDGDSVMDDTNDALQVNVVAGSTSGTEYTEDDAAPSNPDAPALSLVRDDALSSQTSTDGDIVTARGTDKGEVYVKHADDITIADGGNTITVDGTVTANLGTVDNAVLDDIAANQTDATQKTQIVDGAGAVIGSTSNALDVNIASGSSAGTEYTEDAVAPADPEAGTLVMTRDDALSTVTEAEGDWSRLRGTAEGALWVQDFNSDAILADTANIDTNVGTIAGAVSGSQMQVDVVAALPAGDNNIGNVDIASSVALDVSAATVTVDLGANNDVTIDNSSIVHAEDAVHNTGDAGIMPLAVRNDSLAALAGTDGDYAPLQVNASGALYIQEDAALDVSAATVTTTPAVTGGGTEAAAQRVTIANDSTGVVSVDDNGGSITVDGTITANLSATDNQVLDNIQTAVETIDNAISGSEMQVDVVASLPAGTNAIGKLAANSGVDIGDVDVTSISAGTNLIGDVGIQGRASGGLSTYYDADLDETAVAVKAGAGTVYSIQAFNTTDAPLFLQLFNVAQGSVSVGSTTPDQQFVVPGNANSDGAGFVISVPQGKAFDTAITAACTTNSEGSGAPGAGACIINIDYK